jgi:hypothetical protein
MPGFVGFNGLGLLSGFDGAGGLSAGLIGGSITGAGASAITSSTNFKITFFKFLSISV